MTYRVQPGKHVGGCGIEEEKAMIDTIMALWNRGSRRRGIRVLAIFFVLCICLSLLSFVIDVPHWIDLAHGHTIALRHHTGGGGRDFLFLSNRHGHCPTR
jgi:hypothetical protein